MADETPANMPKGHRISVIGAGLAGLTLGRCLHQKGIKTSIFEKARKSVNRNNYGVTLYSKSYLPLLQVLQLDEATFRKKVAVDSHLIGGTGSIRGQGEKDCFKANKNRLEALLAEELEVKWDHELTNLEALPGAVELEFKNHSRHASTYVVGADGPHSIVRGKILPEAGLTTLPYATYNGKRRVSREEWERDFAPGFEGGNVVEKRVGNEGTTLLQISLNSVSDDEASINYVFSRPAKRSGEDALYRPQRDKAEAKDVPDELFAEVKALQDQLSGPLKLIFEPEAMKKDRLLNWLMRSLHVDTTKLGQPAEEGIVLIGDAIHAEPILGGMGANQSIEDAMALAEILAQKDARVQGLYDRRAGEWQKGLREAESRIGNMHGVASRASL
ncbi:hypothetical protein CB0940_03220 [Cercospora beticola]|uniref:FAD-binding domain-containing protein n=2 Tax=Cercospora beticola TaxID=122368 RepID=A0A2G5I4D7_CERBT|nr:hypothetical protein CB0940_03220 [Cercospora beticola]PIA99611.1 hypothetical protein CB0940_03220 [Cercospora beticola]